MRTYSPAWVLMPWGEGRGHAVSSIANPAFSLVLVLCSLWEEEQSLRQCLKTASKNSAYCEMVRKVG